MGHRQVRLQPDCLLVFAFGATRVSSLIQDRSEVVVNQGGIRVKTQRLAIGCRRATEIAILRQHVAQQNPGTGIARNESKTQADLERRALPVSTLLQDACEVKPHLPVIRRLCDDGRVQAQLIPPDRHGTGCAQPHHADIEHCEHCQGQPSAPEHHRQCGGRQHGSDSRQVEHPL